MTVTRQPIRPTAEKSHRGWLPDGTVIRSSEPVENQVTNYIRHLVQKLRAELWAPFMFVHYIGLERDPVLRGLFSPATMAEWSVLDRFHLWPMSRAASSVEQTIRCFGTGTHPWTADENQWARWCDRAETLHGERPRREYVWYLGIEHDIPEGGTVEQVVKQIIANMPETKFTRFILGLRSEGEA